MDEKPLFSVDAPPSAKKNSVKNGIAIWLLFLIVVGLLIIGIAMGISGSAGITMVIVMFQPGFWQLLFVIPAVVILRRRKRFESAKGVLICASFLFILNVICSGSLFLGSRR